MKRSLRLLLILAPLMLLLVGVPLGVALAQRTTKTPPVDQAGGLLINVAATPTYAPNVGPRMPTFAPRSGPPVPTYAPNFVGPRRPTYAPNLGPTAPAPVVAASAVVTKGGTPAPTSNAQTGMSGTITALGPDRFTVFTKSQRIAVVLVDSGKTTIRFNNRNVTLTTLMVGDNVTILGRRDATNAFHAELVRVVRPEPVTDPAAGY